MAGVGVLTEDTTGTVVPGTSVAGIRAAVKGGRTIQLTWVVIVTGKVVTGGETVEGTLASTVIPVPKPGGTMTTRPSLEAVVTAPAGNEKPGNPVGQAGPPEGQNPREPIATHPQKGMVARLDPPRLPKESQTYQVLVGKGRHQRP